LDKNYTPLRQKYRKELRRMDEETKKDGGVVDWNYILMKWIIFGSNNLLIEANV